MSSTLGGPARQRHPARRVERVQTIPRIPGVARVTSRAPTGHVPAESHVVVVGARRRRKIDILPGRVVEVGIRPTHIVRKMKLPRPGEGNPRATNGHGKRCGASLRGGAAPEGERSGQGHRERPAHRQCRHRWAARRCRARNRSTRARLPQSPDAHQRRELFRLWSRKSQPQPTPAHMRARRNSFDSSNSAAATATGHHGRSRSGWRSSHVTSQWPPFHDKRALSNALRRAAWTTAAAASLGVRCRPNALPISKMASRSARARRSASRAGPGWWQRAGVPRAGLSVSVSRAHVTRAHSR